MELPISEIRIGKRHRKDLGDIDALGQKSGGGDKRSEKAEQERSRITCPKAKQDESARTSSVAAAAVGMSRANYEKAKAVVASGNASAIDNMQKRELHP